MGGSLCSARMQSPTFNFDLQCGWRHAAWRPPPSIPSKSAQITERTDTTLLCLELLYEAYFERFGFSLGGDVFGMRRALMECNVKGAS